jgi:hypothetical protein
MTAEEVENAAVPPKRRKEKKSRAHANHGENKRDGKGRYLTGVSGNPNGRPPITPEMKMVRELAAVEREANIASLVRIRDHSKDIWARIEAIKLLLQYSDGKPVTAHAGAPLVSVNLNQNIEPRTVSADEAASVYMAMVRGQIHPGSVRFALPAPLDEAPTVVEGKQ